jgi:putative SOS response-associated peptidase YedK
MLTINAEEHPLMRRFHKPGAEKRSVVVLRPEQYDDWLGCRSTDEARSFLSLFPADEMAAVPAPIPPRRPKPKSEDTESLL